MRTLAAPGTRADQGLTRGRVALFAATSVLAPAVAIVQAVVGEPRHVVISIASGVIFLLVLVRVAGLVRVHGQLAEETSATSFESRLGALVRHSSDVVAILTPDGDPLHVSPSVEGLVGKLDDLTEDVGRRPPGRPVRRPPVPRRARTGRVGRHGLPRPRRRRLLAGRRDAGDEPRRRPGGRRHRHQHARRHRPQGARAPTPAPGEPRHAHRPAEPHAAARPGRAGARPPPAQRRAARGDLPRPRRLQERQRLARPRRGRRGAAGGRPPPGQLHPRLRHRGAPGRRRVRRPHRRPRPTRARR